MNPFQASPSRSTDPDLVETLQSLEWVDVTALAVLLVFFALGLIHGMRWQLGRLTILILSYTASIGWGGRLAEITESWFKPEVGSQLPLYVAQVTLFVVALVFLSVITHLLKRLVSRAHKSDDEELEDRTGPSPLSRLFAAGAGSVSAFLVILALLTGAHMLEAGTGYGAGVVHAAERSHAREVAHEVLELAETVLPGDWAMGSERWRTLLGDAAPRLDGR